MKSLILWVIILIAFLAYTFPPLQESHKRWALVVKTLLSGIIGGCCGMGIADAMLAIIL